MGRAVRLLLALFLTLAGAVGLVTVTAGPAAAAADQIDSYAITYDLQPDGVLKATETIVWRFGSSSGRHGILRKFVTVEN